MRLLALFVLTLFFQQMYPQTFCTSEFNFLDSEGKVVLCLESDGLLQNITNLRQDVFCFNMTAVKAMSKLDFSWVGLKWREVLIIKLCNAEQLRVIGVNELASVVAQNVPHIYFENRGKLTFKGNCLQRLFIPKGTETN